MDDFKPINVLFVPSPPPAMYLPRFAKTSCHALDQESRMSAAAGRVFYLRTHRQARARAHIRQALFVMFTLILVLQMTNPAIQNDFSYYRRTLSRMRINNTPVS
jgi:hypothetical protein